ncbi:MAG TPA: ATP synthase F0 subunit B [Clostridiales bacterium]|nr:ATP synthase F0 subunit B [Clostridiales bacterium]
MQSLDVISVNIWQILISLANLAILFFIIKKFLYKPVKNVLEKRKNAVNEGYAAAEKAKSDAEETKKLWDEKITGANDKAKAIVDEAVKTAKKSGDKIVAEAKTEASNIVKKAEEDAADEKRKARAEMKDEIASISATISEKILSREINEKDHKAIVDSVIDSIGEDDDENS